MLNKADLIRFSKIVGEDNVKIDEPMSQHSSFKVGGSADLLLYVDSLEKLQAILDLNEELKLPITVIGNGTNILVKEEGIRGIVVKYVAKGISKATLDNNTFAITAEAGLPNAMLANELLNDSLTGFEFAASIPGTIGGAIYMNAGAFGSEMIDIVSEVTYLDLDDLAIYKSDGDDCDFSYRHSKFENMNTIILSATMVFNKGDKEEIKRTMDAYLQKRLETQPYDKPNAGSTFKRGDGFITAMLIDEAGLKGYSIGGAQVSEKHAGFIINKGNATAKDILDLIKYVQDTVMEKYGKAIEPEVRILG